MRDNERKRTLGKGGGGGGADKRGGAQSRYQFFRGGEGEGRGGGGGRKGDGVLCTYHAKIPLSSPSLQRYYGESLPYDAASFQPKNIGYLSAEQALADYAVTIQLIYAIPAYQNITKVISFGGR